MSIKLVPYLTFENTKEALQYYQDVFGATDVYRISPTAKQAEDLSLNANVNLEDLTFQAGFKLLGLDVQCADSFYGQTVISSTVSLMLQVNLKDADETQALKDLYNRLVKSDEVKVLINLDKKTTGNIYGQIVDKYGITWIFNAVKE